MLGKCKITKKSGSMPPNLLEKKNYLPLLKATKYLTDYSKLSKYLCYEYFPAKFCHLQYTPRPPPSTHSTGES